MPTLGPNSPDRRLAETSALPAPPVTVGGEDSYDDLSPEDIRARLVARERDLKFHLAALRHEAMTVGDDLNIGGRPVMDIIRARPALALAAAAAVGALLGSLLGLRARSKRRPKADDDVDFVRARLAMALEDAAQRVARGTDPEAALRASMRTVPVIYGDSQAPTAQQARSSAREAVDVAVKSAVGFAAKAAMDQVTKKLTGHEETFAAVADAAEG